MHVLTMGLYNSRTALKNSLAVHHERNCLQSQQTSTPKQNVQIECT